MEVGKILEIKNLNIAFQNGKNPLTAVNDLSFTLHRGETLAIVGESGSGKSVTALSILGLLPFPEGKITGGKILFHDHAGKDYSLTDLPQKKMRYIRGKEISMIFQEPMTSLNPVLTCGFQVTETILQHLKIKRKEASLKTLEKFAEVKLPNPEEIYESYPHQLSGGQKQRVMIAMAMSCNPSLLIADEPTTALDVTVQKTILDLMKSLRRKYRMSIIFITHDLALVSGFADRIIVMYKGTAVEEGETKSVFRSPVHPYTSGLLNCRPRAGLRLKKLPTIGDFMNTRSPAVLTRETETPEERKNRHQTIYSKSPVLEIKDLETEFPSHYSFFGTANRFVKAVNHISFEVFRGETLGIVGESGCGKTTLGRSILRLIRIKSGKIVYEGREIQGMAQSEFRNLRRDLQIIFQDPYSSLNPRLTAGAAIMEPMRGEKDYHLNSQKEKRTMDLLQMVGLDEEHFFRYPHEFSGGQRQRICIARTLAVNPKVIICDESVSALDVSNQAQILNLLKSLQNEFGFTYIFISHDLSVVRFMSDRLIVMKNGRIEEAGDPDQIYNNPGTDYTKLLLDSMPGLNFPVGN